MNSCCTLNANLRNISSSSTIDPSKNSLESSFLFMGLEVDDSGEKGRRGKGRVDSGSGTELWGWNLFRGDSFRYGQRPGRELEGEEEL